jgi:FkbM family methyltransferase
MDGKTLLGRAFRRNKTELEAWRLALKLVSDPVSAVKFRRLLLVRRGFHKERSDYEPVGVRLRPLRGATVKLRPASADVRTVVDVFVDREHLPPALDGRPTVIVDLGANIGLTMAHFATLYPTARIVGAELDPSNAKLARENVMHWRDRCRVVSAGIWTRDGTVSYARRDGREVSHSILSSEIDETATATADSITVASLLSTCGIEGEIDYVKMDIEGAERDVLKEGHAWAARVRVIKVEIHPPYTLDECQSELAALGFQTRAQHGRCTYVTGTRKPAALVEN